MFLNKVLLKVKWVGLICAIINLSDDLALAVVANAYII